MAVRSTTKPTAAADAELLDALAELLRAEDASVALVGAGREVSVPRAVIDVLRDAVGHLQQGESVQALPDRDDLSASQAADVLNVSDDYFEQLLDNGDIPFETVNGQRRVGIYRLMIYKANRDARRHAALNEIARLSEEMGLYDLDDEGC